MTEQVRYVARQRFKYNGKWCMPGDEWTPAGSRYDNAIIRNRLVTAVRVPPEVKMPQPKKAESPAPAKRGREL